MGEGRLGDEAGFRRGGEGAVVDEGQDVTQLVQLHRESLWNRKKIGLGRITRPVVPWRCAWVAIILIGALVGYLGGMFGKGGSAIATPLLAAAGVPAIVAVASPLPATVPGTLVAYRRYRHARPVRPVCHPYEPGGGYPGDAPRRVPATDWIAGGTLLVVTDVVVAHRPAHLVRGTPPEVGVDDPEHRGLRLVAVAAAVGLLAGLLANAGGFLLVPLYLAVLKLPVKTAFACSLAVASVSALPGTIVHAVRWARSTGGWPLSSGRRRSLSPGSGRRPRSASARLVWSASTAPASSCWARRLLIR